MTKKEQLCQQELEIYGKFHQALNTAASFAHVTQTADYVKTDTFKNTFDSLVVNMMKAENGDKFEANYRNFKTLLDKELSSAHITPEIHKALLEPVDKLQAQRSVYLSKPFKDEKSWKKNTWILAGTAIIATALALTVVAAPLIPAAVVGGAALAYGIADQTNELADHIKEASNENLASMHHQKFDDFKHKLDTGEINHNHKVDIKTYITANKAPLNGAVAAEKENIFKRGLKAIGKATGISTLFSNETNTRQKLKTAAKILGVAGLGLAVAAMIAVFPPIGIPLAAGIAIGIASTAVVAATAVVVATEQMEAQKAYTTLANEHENHSQALSAALDNTYSESIKQTEKDLLERGRIENMLASHREEASPHHLQHSEQVAVEHQSKPCPPSPRGVADLNKKIQPFEKQHVHSNAETAKLFEGLAQKLEKQRPSEIIQQTHSLKDAAKELDTKKLLETMDEEDEGENEGIRLHPD